MTTLVGNPLTELSADALYKLLGEAWITQLRPKPGENYYLGPSLEAGKREFDAIVPELREDLKRPYPHGVVDCVANTINRLATWPMPENVVAELATRLGMAMQPQESTLVAQ